MCRYAHSCCPGKTLRSSRSGGRRAIIQFLQCCNVFGVAGSLSQDQGVSNILTTVQQFNHVHMARILVHHYVICTNCGRDLAGIFRNISLLIVCSVQINSSTSFSQADLDIYSRYLTRRYVELFRMCYVTLFVTTSTKTQ